MFRLIHLLIIFVILPGESKNVTLFMSKSDVMCVNSLQVKNPRFKTGTFNPNIDSLYLTVPCGRCYECLMAKQRDWLCRSFIQYEYINDIGGQTYYYTLTYDDNQILSCPSVDSRRVGFSLLLPHKRTLFFNPAKVKGFLKRINARLSRRGIDFSYFLVSELGSHTLRPHHHALFHVNKYVDPDLFYKLVNECWSYGFVMPGNNCGVVNSLYAVQYVCKYLSKDGYKKRIKSVSQYTPKSFKIFNSWLNRHIGNFTRVSNCYGWHPVQLRRHISPDYTSIRIVTDSNYKDFALPVYYQRKLLCDSFINPNGNVSYRPNDLGWKVMSKLFKNISESYLCTVRSLNAHFDTDFNLDEVLFWNLCLGLPRKQLKHSFESLFFMRHVNNGVTCRIPDNWDYSDNIVLSAYQQERYMLYRKLNSLLSYENYVENKKSYNVRQRVKYRQKPECLTILNYKNYVSVPA